MITFGDTLYPSEYWRGQPTPTLYKMMLTEMKVVVITGNALDAKLSWRWPGGAAIQTRSGRVLSSIWSERRKREQETCYPIVFRQQQGVRDAFKKTRSKGSVNLPQGSVQFCKFSCALQGVLRIILKRIEMFRWLAYTWFPIVHCCTPDCPWCTVVLLIAHSALLYTWFPIVHWHTPDFP